MPRASLKKDPAIVEAPVTMADKLKALMATRPEDLTFMTGTAGRWPDEKVIRTGSIGLDRAIGIGGWPKGRIIEIFGPFSSGKTSISLLTLARAQEGGVPSVFIDAENAFDPNYAKKLGVDLDCLLVNQPSGLENAIDLMMHLMDNAPEEGLFLVVDSVAQLEPTEAMEGEAGKEIIGLKARRWSQNLPKLTKKAKESNSTIILINQEREKVNPKPWEEKKSIPGGNAIKFGASLRLRISRKVLDKGEESGATGQIVFVDVQKNKVGSPYKKASFFLPAGKPIDWAKDIIAEAIKAGVILEDTKIETDKAGKTTEAKGKSWYSLPLTEKRWAAVRACDPEAVFKADNAISVYTEKKFVNAVEQYPDLIELLEEELLDMLSDEDGGNVAASERSDADDEGEISDGEAA